MPTKITTTNRDVIRFVEAILTEFILAGCRAVFENDDEHDERGFNEAVALLVHFDNSKYGNAARALLLELQREHGAVIIARLGAPREPVDDLGGFGAVGFGKIQWGQA